jgi:hypothetical protein
MTPSILAAALLLPLPAIAQQDQQSGKQNQQAARQQAPKQSQMERRGPHGERLAGTQPAPATGTVPNDASGAMSARHSLNSGASPIQSQHPPASKQERAVGTSRPTPYGSTR